MRKLIPLIIIILCLSIPARADTGPRPHAWETVAATKISRQEHKRRTPTSTVTPWATLEPYPYPIAEDEPPALWRWVWQWIAE